MLDFLFPKHCVSCRASGSYLCMACESKIKPFSFPLCPGCGFPVRKLAVHPNCQHLTELDGLVALGKHEGVLKELVKHIKYYRHFDMCSTVAAKLAEKIPFQVLSHKNIIITWVPLHPKRERQRGYNQSQLLAKALAKSLKLPAIPLLRKTKSTRPQAGLSRQQRLTNLSGVFVARHKLKDEHILLVDDVTTTRTTLNECARALKQAGARRVFGIVLAHGK